ncbi:MAG: Co2+/Mg2+ efflux protein ApaG [Robiginitomaculum sp.]|nr:Co2+/Mg2+ efflux protein ApaG [Robiginitomaculum sp.]
MTMTWEKTTNGILVRVEPFFLDERSSVSERRFVWAYQVEIENHSDITVQVLNRYWRITDAHGHVEEVYGPGVVGEQPVLAPGQSYRYTSGTPLTTPSGLMEGYYEMQGNTGMVFRAPIPLFFPGQPP